MSALPRRILVTGGGSGIGRAVAAMLVERGAEVLICGRRQEVLEQAARQTGATAVVADVLDTSSLPGRCGPLDGLVHNAGRRVHASVGDWTQEDWQALWELHVQAPAMLSQAFARQCEGPGAIVAVSSTLALRGLKGAAAYSATKAALLALVRSLAIELAPQGIRANAVLPGAVPTDMVLDGLRQPAELAALTAQHPLGLGTPEDVALAVVALLENPWTTGTEMVVDGGLLAGWPVRTRD